MSNPVTVSLDPSDPVLSGEAAGLSARATLGLDTLDQDGAPAVVRIGSSVITSSFIAGLLGQSVRALGLDGFRAKYAFEATPMTRERIRLYTPMLVDPAP